MIRSYKRILVSHLLKVTNIGKAVNIARSYITYPKSKYVLTCGLIISYKCNRACEVCHVKRISRKYDLDMDTATVDRILKMNGYIRISQRA